MVTLNKPITLKNYSIWPHRSGLDVNSFLSKITASQVEERLNNLYPGGYAVLTTSGRNALNLALRTMELKRSDYVQTFPYASHCVFDAISKIATPTRYAFHSKRDTILVYHQWGLRCEYYPSGKLIIDDSVDTLCEPEAGLFPGQGQFEIWSAPKIFGVRFGGVLWCQNYSEYMKAKEIQELGTKNPVYLCLRQLGHRFPVAYNLWQSMECTQGIPHNYIAAEINESLDQLEKLISYKKQLINIAMNELNLKVNFQKNRLPTALPVKKLLSSESIQKLGISTCIRHYTNTVDINGNSEQVIALPIHADIPIVEFRELVKCLKN